MTIEKIRESLFLGNYIHHMIFNDVQSNHPQHDQNFWWSIRIMAVWCKSAAIVAQEKHVDHFWRYFDGQGQKNKISRPE